MLHIQLSNCIFYHLGFDVIFLNENSKAKTKTYINFHWSSIWKEHFDNIQIIIQVTFAHKLSWVEDFAVLWKALKTLQAWTLSGE